MSGDRGRGRGGRDGTSNNDAGDPREDEAVSAPGEPATLIYEHEEDSSSDLVTETAAAEAPIINNELLCYAQFHSHRTAIENIANVIKRFYNEGEIIKAKDTLATAYKGKFTYELRNRRNTGPSKNKQAKQKFEATVDDIMAVMKELDEKGIVTCFVATNLARLPNCDPKDVDPYCNHQLILELKKECSILRIM